VAARIYLNRNYEPKERNMRIDLVKLISVFLLTLLLVSPVCTQTIKHFHNAIKAPRVFLLDPEQLVAAKRLVISGDKNISPALTKLELDARRELTAGPFSVTTKQITPPSGDKHDYMSHAPYFWRDPTKPNGLPYIRRDGERNPEINKISDHRTLDQMVAATETLALFYYLKGDEASAARAAVLLRAWFLDPATRMNPNLQYAQGIPGINTGRGIGLIETRGLTRVVDAIGLLAGSKAWTEGDQRGLTAWYSSFLNWMLESKNGRDESAAKNNHGTYYDVQACSFALFVGRPGLAAEILKTSRSKRIATQIEPDGRQPLELVRTKAWSYSVGNLDGLMLLATLGERVGVDLWKFQTPDGRSIRKATEYLIPYALGESKWPYQQLGEWPPSMLFPLLRRAELKFGDDRFRSLITKIPRTNPSDRASLLHVTAVLHKPLRETS
jgi:Alginate lyase